MFLRTRLLVWFGLVMAASGTEKTYHQSVPFRKAGRMTERDSKSS
jgi:hypothetical protein